MGGDINSIIGFLNGDTPKKVIKPTKLQAKIDRFEKLFFDDNTWRDNKILWDNFYDGYHWTSEELNALKERKQPDVVYNRIKTGIDVVVGLEKQNRQKINIFGRDVDLDPAVAESMNEATRFVEQNNKYEFVQSDVFEEGIRSGRGWFHVFVEPDEMDKPEIKIEYVPNDDIVFDRTSVRYDLKDAKDLAHTVWMDIDDVYARFPKKRKKINEAVDFLNFERAGFSQHTTTYGDQYTFGQENRQGQDLWFDRKNKQVRIVNYWYRVNEMRKVLIHPDLGYHVLEKNLKDDEILNTIELVQQEMGIDPQLVEKHVRLSRVCTYIGNTLLEDKESDFQNDMFPYIPFFGFRERKTGDHYGLIKQAIDPQRELNKRRSKALHLLNSKQVIYDDGAFEDDEVAREEFSKPDTFLAKRKGFEVDIRDDRNLGNAQLEMYQLSSTEIDDSMSVNRESLGQKSNIRSTSGIERKIAQGMTALARLFINWKHSKILMKETLVSFIQEYWDPEKAIRVTNDQNVVQFIQFGKELDADEGVIPFNEFISRKFDVIYDVGEDYLNMQEQTFAELAKMAQTGMIPPQVLLEFAPIPFEQKQRILGMLQQQQAPSPEEEAGSSSQGGVTNNEAEPGQAG